MSFQLGQRMDTEKSSASDKNTFRALNKCTGSG